MKTTTTTTNSTGTATTWGTNLIAAAYVTAAIVVAIAGFIVRGADAAPQPTTYCTTFDARVAANLDRLGHDLAYGSGVWGVDGQVVGHAPAEDIDFRACGTGPVANALRAASTLRCGVRVDDVVVDNLRAAGHRARFVWDDFDGGWWHIDGVRVVSTDGPDVLASGCAPATLATAIEAAQP